MEIQHPTPRFQGGNVRPMVRRGEEASMVIASQSALPIPNGQQIEVRSGTYVDRPRTSTGLTPPPLQAAPKTSKSVVRLAFTCTRLPPAP